MLVPMYFIGVVNPLEADRLPLRGVGLTGRRLELEPRLNIKTDLTGQAKLGIFQRSLIDQNSD